MHVAPLLPFKIHVSCTIVFVCCVCLRHKHALCTIRVTKGPLCNYVSVQRLASQVVTLTKHLDT